MIWIAVAIGFAICGYFISWEEGDAFYPAYDPAEWLETAEALYRTLLTQTDRRDGERVLASLVHAASGPRPAGVKQAKRGTARGAGGSRKSA